VPALPVGAAGCAVLCWQAGASVERGGNKAADKTGTSAGATPGGRPTHCAFFWARPFLQNVPPGEKKAQVLLSHTPGIPDRQPRHPSSGSPCGGRRSPRGRTTDSPRTPGGAQPLENTEGVRAPGAAPQPGVRCFRKPVPCSGGPLHHRGPSSPPREVDAAAGAGPRKAQDLREERTGRSTESPCPTSKLQPGAQCFRKPVPCQQRSSPGGPSALGKPRQPVRIAPSLAQNLICALRGFRRQACAAGRVANRGVVRSRPP